ncbi:MAG: helix-turn-helix transcriptional regulator [Actinobacteria bacterium]|nr:helix-turn-helix transcriptional regulator [Actinomycetota bacterium]
MDLRREFGANLRQIREERKLSQEDLMALAGVHRTQISEYERGRTAPEVEVLAKLSCALEVPIGALLAGIGWQEPLSAEPAERR